MSIHTPRPWYALRSPPVRRGIGDADTEGAAGGDRSLPLAVRTSVAARATATASGTIVRRGWGNDISSTLVHPRRWPADTVWHPSRIRAWSSDLVGRSPWSRPRPRVSGGAR